MNVEHITELSQPLDSTLLVVTQHPTYFQLNCTSADQKNHLFSLYNGGFLKRLYGLENPKVERDYLLGVHAYQVVSLMAYDDQPLFTHPPDDAVAQASFIQQMGTTSPDDLVERGVDKIDELAADAPLLTETTYEIVDHLLDSKGAARIAMGGVAMMRECHASALDMLDRRVRRL